MCSNVFWQNVHELCQNKSDIACLQSVSEIFVDIGNICSTGQRYTVSATNTGKLWF